MAESHIAVASWSLRPESPDDLIEKLRAIGIDRIQLDLSAVVADPQVWFPALQRLRDEGITIVSGMMTMAEEDYSSLESIAATGGIRPDETWPMNRARAEMVLSLAAGLELDLITFHAGFIPEDGPERAVLIDRLEEFADGFMIAGMRLGLETGQETATTLADLLNELDHPGVGVNFDPANMLLYGKGDPVDALRRLALHVVQVHIKDAVPSDEPGRTWGREVPVGTGAVDWPQFLEAVEACCPGVELVIEREAGDDRVADIITARTFLEGSLTT